MEIIKMRALPVLLASLTTSLVLTVTDPAAKADPVRNVVLVHGAFADGSGWQGVYERLVDKGFKVSVVQDPKPASKMMLQATRRVIDDAGRPGYPSRP